MLLRTRTQADRQVQVQVSLSMAEKGGKGGGGGGGEGDLRPPTTRPPPLRAAKFLIAELPEPDRLLPAHVSQAGPPRWSPYYDS